MEDFTVTVQNFGPIQDGSLKIKPMTILLGKNNTGKSYMAMLIHTFLESSNKINGFLNRDLIYNSRFYYEKQLRLRELALGRYFSPVHGELFTPELRSQIETILKNFKTKKSFDLPEPFVSELTDRLSKSIETEFKRIFIEEMERIFGCTMYELCTQGKEKLSIIFALKQTEIIVNSATNGTTVKIITKKPIITLKAIQIKKEPFESSSIIGENITLCFPIHLAERFEKVHNELTEYFLTTLRDSLSEYLLGTTRLSNNSFYLPAARSGILSAHKVLASGLLRELPYIGIRKMEFLPLSGTITDFLANIIQLPRRTNKFADLAALLEDKITSGKIDIKEMEKMTYPEIFYESKNLKLPIHRSSSMVSEMAPLILYLKYLLEEDSTLVIEEPESHLHPEAQTKLAKILIRLSNRRVRVIATSHSDFLLHQIQNSVLISHISSKKLLTLNYDKQDSILSSNVAVYLFKRNGVGTILNEVNICDTTMKDSGFTEVSEELYGDSVRIDRALDTNKN